MAYRLTAPVDLEVAGRSWRLVFTHRVILDIEQMTGIDAMSLHLGDLNAKMLRIVLCAVLGQAGTTLTLEETGALMIPDDVPRIQNALYHAWAASLPDPDTVRKTEGGRAAPLPTIEAWARARFDLRLSDREWLAMTPRMLYALTERHLEHMRHRETMIAVLTAHTINHSFRPPRELAQPNSFMLHPWPMSPVAEEAHKGIVYGEDIMAALR